MPNRSRQELLDLCVFLFLRKGKIPPHVGFRRFSPLPMNIWMLVNSSSQHCLKWVIWLFAGFGKPQALPARLHLPTRTSSRPVAGATRHNRPPKKLQFYIRPPGDDLHYLICFFVLTLTLHLCFSLQTQAPLTAAIM